MAQCAMGAAPLFIDAQLHTHADTERHPMKTVLTAVALTIVAVVVSVNFLTPEKQLDRKLDHLYP